MELPDIQQAEIQKAIEGLPAERRRALLLWLQALEQPAPISRKFWKAKPPKPWTLKQAVLWTVLSVAAFFLVDAAIFRSGWYYNYLEPDSTAGQLESHLFWLRHTLPDRIPEVAVVGDSRIAEGFGARKAGEAVGNKIHFWNLGVPGASPRAWYYLLRDADPTRRRFQALVLGIDHYSDEDGPVDIANRITDLNYLIGRLRLTDCFDFADSFPSADLHRPVLTGCFFKAVTLRRDVQGLLANRRQRFTAAKDWRNNGHGYIDGYGGKPEDLVGLKADFATHTLTFPPGAKDWQRSSTEGTVMPQKVPQTGELTRYRRLWLGRILDLYKNSSTRIVFLELPRGPLPPQELTAPPVFLESVERRPRITILSQHLFRDLEHPDLFADGLHLNHVGRPIFSERLGAKIAEILGVH